MSAAALRLLLATARGGGSGISFPFAPIDTILTTATDGGWTQASDPSGVYDAAEGVVLFGYVDASGNVEVRTYDGTTVSSPFVLHATLDADTHAAPSVLLLADGHYLAAYSAHSGSQFYVRRSTNAHDATAWDAEVLLDATLGGTMYTYPILFQLADGTVWLFYRDEQDTGATAVMCYTTSTNGGVSWSAQTEVYENNAKLSYWQVYSDGGTRIDFVTTDGHPGINDPCKLYHFYWEAGVYHKSDGTTITVPHVPADLTLVYDSADGPAWAYALTRDGSGNPHFVYAVIESGTNSYRHAHWNGSAWVNSTIADSGGVIEGVAAAGLTQDPQDPSYVYASVKVGSHWEIQRFHSGDTGATWNAPDDITSGSTYENIVPKAIRDHGPDQRILWLAGTYTDYLDNSLAVHMDGTAPGGGSGGGGGGGGGGIGGTGGGTYPTTLQDAIDAMSPGDTLDVTGYTFHEAVTIATDNITIEGCVIDGDGVRTYWADVTGDDVTLRNMTFTNCAVEALPGGFQHAGVAVSGARFEAENLLLENGPYACMRLWSGAEDAIITDCDMSYGPEVGLLGFESHGTVVSGGRYHHNQAGSDVGNEAGGIKFGGSDGITFQNVEADHNAGPGLWSDFSDGVTFTGNRTHHNTKAGIMFEIGDTASITGNTSYRNGSDGVNAYESISGIMVSSSRNATVTGNTVAYNSSAAADIAFVSQNRSPLPHNGNVGTGNILRSAVTGIAAYTDWADTGGSNTISPNTLVSDSDPALAGL